MTLVLCLNIQYLTTNDKKLLTNINRCGIIYSQTENSSEVKNMNRRRIMGNTKLTSKIKAISRISAVGVIAYLAFTIYSCFPDAKTGFIDGWNSVDNDAETIPLWRAILFVLCAVALLTALIVTIVAGLQLLFRMSRGASPFTEKISRAIKNMGVGLIVFEITMDILNYIDSGKISIGMMWLAGLVLYAFSLVFRYGTVLQKESDETL